ncbi:hypothetical protein CCMA1212_008209 [Trichoderma ghanense]|uniref:C2H2-type domain-containing protein n=1 Tax=Trichoderma ghanense TaxID=65468 RepID=A0ABY2GWJ0_9HYPO
MPPSPSQLIATANAFISAYNKWTVPDVLSIRSPSCKHHVLPGIKPPRNNQDFGEFPEGDAAGGGRGGEEGDDAFEEHRGDGCRTESDDRKTQCSALASPSATSSGFPLLFTAITGSSFSLSCITLSLSPRQHIKMDEIADDVANHPARTPVDVALKDYLIEGPAPEGEGDKLFACPHLGCDGFTFETVYECQIHEEEWHKPPYFCSDCGANFAARTALKRHLKSTGHFNWVCCEETCVMKGILFANQAEFVSHALNTPGHEHLFPGESLQSPGSARRINLMEGELGEESSSDDEGHICPEPSCRRYQHVFYTETEFTKHTESHGHIHAVKHSESLRESGKSIADIETEQEAAREFRCTARHCAYFGEKLKHSQSYYRHIATAQHLTARLIESNPASPTAEIRLKFAQISLTCDEPECPKFEHSFLGRGNHNKHTNSVAHRKAVEYGQLKRAMVGSAVGGRESVKAQTPEREKPTAEAAPPTTPQIWSRSLFTPISPATSTFRTPVQLVTPTKRQAKDVVMMSPPPSSRREESLKKRNRELEEELRETKEKMERMRNAYQEQISSLFQTLGETQSRSVRYD